MSLKWSATSGQPGMLGDKRVSKHASSERGSAGSTPDQLLALDATVYDRQMIPHLLLSGAGRQLRSKQHSWRRVQYGIGCTRLSVRAADWRCQTSSVREEMDISNAISNKQLISSGN